MTAATFRLPANPVEAHKAMLAGVWPQIKALTMGGNPVVVEVRLAEDVRIDKLRGYLHAYVLPTIAAQAQVNSEKFPAKVWKEHFRSEFLGSKTVTTKNPITGKKVRRRTRVSTEDLGVRGYSDYIERVTAFAATELGVEFMDEWVHPETGEVIFLSKIRKAKK